MGSATVTAAGAFIGGTVFGAALVVAVLRYLDRTIGDNRWGRRGRRDR